MNKDGEKQKERNRAGGVREEEVEEKIRGIAWH